MTLATTLRERASSIGDEPAVRFKEGEEFVTWTWSAFWDQARRVAMGLISRGIEPGDHVMLLVPEPRAAVAAHFGVWAMGGVPTQVGLPYRLHDVGAFVAELRATGRRIDARALVMSRAVAAFAPQEEGAPVFVVDDWIERPIAGDPPPIDAHGPALIQLTSGSTGAPRGVVISHDALALHLDSISAALPATRACVGVTWLPLHHDMGLIGGLLYPFVNRFVVHVLSPLEFQARPFSWLETMSRVRATHTAAPPSAFAVAIALARKAAEAKLDLSSITCAMTGAEPVAPALLRRFSQAFAPTGFRPEAFFPVYGLAEATVAVTFPKPMTTTRSDRIDRRAIEHDREARPSAGEEGSIEIASVGRPIPRTEIRLVDEHGSDVGERRVGEILVRSESLMDGYYDDPEGTRDAIEDGWLRTGDLGYRADGDLFITGRKKEIIIKAGRNLAPAMLEEVAASVPGVRAGCVAAVGVREAMRETEIVYLVAETKAEASEHEGIAARVREALKAHGVAIDHVRLVAPGTLPKTTSGKIRRALVRDAIAEETR